MFACPTLNGKYLGSWNGMRMIFLLVLTGGIFGILAQTALATTTNCGQAMMLIAVAAWITTLLIWAYEASGRNSLTVNTYLGYSVAFAVAFIILTVCWAIYDTFVGTLVGSNLLIFILSLITTVVFCELAFCSCMTVYRQRKGTILKSDNAKKSSTSHAVALFAEPAAEEVVVKKTTTTTTTVQGHAHN